MTRFDYLAQDLKERFLSVFQPDPNDMLILYGSAAGGKTTSDFDCCFIRAQGYTSEELKKAVDAIISFHTENGLRLDDEVPHENKLLYSKQELLHVITQTPFYKDHTGKIIIDQIEKSKKFLSSPQIKERLLFNLLTTNSCLLLGNAQKFEFYKAKAWDSLSKLMFAYTDNKYATPADFIQNLCTDPVTQKSGEDFLGYKENRPLIMRDLFNKTNAYFENAAQTGTMKSENGRYQFNPADLQSFIDYVPLKSETDRQNPAPLFLRQHQKEYD